MKLRAVELTVGAFMIAGILALLMLALQVSGLGNIFREEPGYKVQAEFNNIGGLKVRAKVSVAGVVVGRVEQIILEPQTYNAKVTFNINPKRIERLPADSRASIMTSGLLGDNYIALTPGFDDIYSLQEGSVIPATSTDSAVVLEQLISKFMASQASKNDGKESSKTKDKKDSKNTSDTKDFKESNKESNKDSSQEISKENSKDIHQDISKESSKEIRKENKKEISKDSSKELSNDKELSLDESVNTHKVQSIQVENLKTEMVGENNEKPE